MKNMTDEVKFVNLIKNKSILFSFCFLKICDFSNFFNNLEFQEFIFANLFQST